MAPCLLATRNLECLLCKAVKQYLTYIHCNDHRTKPSSGVAEKIRFIVTDPNEENKSEKYFDVGKRSVIVAKLKEGFNLLRIERIGSGKETLYIPTQVAIGLKTTLGILDRDSKYFLDKTRNTFLPRQRRV